MLPLCNRTRFAVPKSRRGAACCARCAAVLAELRQFQLLTGGVSTRAVQRSIGPCPLQVSVAVPAPVMLAVCPLLKFPVNPGATTWHDGTGFEFCASDVAFMQVTLAGPVIAAVAGCTTPLSTVACIDCTLPRDLCAPVPNAIANITKAGTAANAIRHLIFIARPPLAVDCTPQSITTVLWSAGACSRFLPPDAFCRTKSRRGAARCAPRSAVLAGSFGFPHRTPKCSSPRLCGVRELAPAFYSRTRFAVPKSHPPFRSARHTFPFSPKIPPQYFATRLTFRLGIMSSRNGALQRQQARSIRNRRAARRGRHGRSLSRA